MPVSERRDRIHASHSTAPVLLPYGLPMDAGAGPNGMGPNWDRETRKFVVGDRLVKHFRVPSPNQAAVLDAFQEEGWPRSVDDPLSPLPDQEPETPASRYDQMLEPTSGFASHSLSRRWYGPACVVEVAGWLRGISSGGKSACCSLRRVSRPAIEPVDIICRLVV